MSDDMTEMVKLNKPDEPGWWWYELSNTPLEVIRDDTSGRKDDLYVFESRYKIAPVYAMKPGWWIKAIKPTPTNGAANR